MCVKRDHNCGSFLSFILRSYDPVARSRFDNWEERQNSRLMSSMGGLHPENLETPYLPHSAFSCTRLARDETPRKCKPIMVSHTCGNRQSACFADALARYPKKSYYQGIVSGKQCNTFISESENGFPYYSFWLTNRSHRLSFNFLPKAYSIRNPVLTSMLIRYNHVSLYKLR